ncbi:MAG: hypothetical protein HY607_06145 [Planctomycetes bacterium]|uniref:hypothetical protein n=1 Tax=Candidatus Wunengus californicus TaxID=3367619 RepID=UPI0040290BEA|nr:hypothetical protein [Planctomycetota bacterium]
MSLETICTFGFPSVIVGIIFIHNTLSKIYFMYKSQINEPRAMKAYEDINDIRLQLGCLTGLMEKLLKREEEKRNILKEKEGESKALLESLIRSVDRLYVDKNKYYGVE